LHISILLAADDDSGGRDNLPDNFVLYQNYPNPANPTTTISFDLIGSEHVQLGIYNLLGQRVHEADLGICESGHHQHQLDLSPYASGVYFYRITAGNKSESKKLMLLK
jgi:hypothetical protein